MKHYEPKKKKKKRRSGVHVVKIYEWFSETTPLSGLNWRKGMVSATSCMALLQPLKGMSCWSLGKSWLSRRWSIIKSWCSMAFCFNCKAEIICCVSIGSIVAGWVCPSYSIKLSYNVNKALYKRGYTISGNCMEEKSHGGLCNPFLAFLINIYCL